MRAPWIHRRLAVAIGDAYALADRADGALIEAVVASLAEAGTDETTVAFLRQAQRLVLDATAALTSVLDTHRHSPYCRTCGTAPLCRTVRDVQEIFFGGGAPLTGR